MKSPDQWSTSLSMGLLHSTCAIFSLETLLVTLVAFEIRQRTLGCQRKHLQMGRSVFLFAELNFGIASQLRPNRHHLYIFLKIAYDGLAVLFFRYFSFIFIDRIFFIRCIHCK